MPKVDRTLDLKPIATTLDELKAPVARLVAWNPPKPKITSFDPPEHVEQKGFPLEIHGEHFQGAEVGVTGLDGAYYWNNPVTFHDPTHITAQIQDGYGVADNKPTEHKVRVWNPIGGYSDEVPYTFTPKPHIDRIQPTEHVEKDAFPLTVEGENFDDKHIVNVGSLDCTTRYTSSSKLEADIPATEVGSYVISVKGPGGDSNEKTLTIIPKPHITSLNPPEYEEHRVFTLHVYGTGFTDTSVVGVTNPAGSPYPRTTHLVEAGHLSAEVDSNYAAGNGKVYVRNGTDATPIYSDEVPFTFTAKPKNPPVITSLEPETQVENVSFTLTVNGRNFNKDATIYIDGPAYDTDYTNSVHIEAKIPSNDGAAVAGDHTVQVKEAGEEPSNTWTLSIKARPKPAPTIDSISPTSWIERDSFTMTVRGEHFVQSAVVWLVDDDGWESHADRTTFESSTELTAHFSDEYNAADHDVQVINPDRQKSNKKSFTFRRKEIHAPYINRLEPATIEEDTPTWIEIHGSYFEPTSQVHYGNAELDSGDGADRFKYISHNEIDVKANSDPGDWTVYVVTRGQKSNTKTLTVTRHIHEEPKGPAPYISELYPDSVEERSGRQVWIRGSHIDPMGYPMHGDDDIITQLQDRGPPPIIRTPWGHDDSPVYISWRNPDRQVSNAKPLTITAKSDEHHEPHDTAPYIAQIDPNLVYLGKSVTVTLLGKYLLDGGKLLVLNQARFNEPDDRSDLIIGTGTRHPNTNSPYHQYFKQDPRWNAPPVQIIWENPGGTRSNAINLNVWR